MALSAADARWSVEEAGFHSDARMSACGFSGGVTTRGMGSMAEAANRARALELAGLGELPAYPLKQVHGNAVLSLAQATASTAEGDGWLVDAPRRVALVFAADCMPVFIWDSKGRAAAALHSGWKGTKANISGAGVAGLRALGVEPGAMQAAIGPHIGSCCYAVGEEFSGYFRAESLERRGGKLFLDIAAEARAQLSGAGVPAQEISVNPACTCCGRDFFSFRRDKQATPMMGFLALSHGR